MYHKSFRQQFDSSIAEDPVHRSIFNDICTLADRRGHCDMTYDAIAAVTRWPITMVITAIGKLCEPDPHSRSKELDGRRLVLLDATRSWGWRIVNYEKYRNRQYGDDERRRAYQRDWIAKKRAAMKASTNVDSRRQTSTRVDKRRLASTNVDFGKSEEPKHKQLAMSTVDRLSTQAEAEADSTHKNSSTQGNSTCTSELEYGGDSNKSNHHQRPLRSIDGLTDSEWLARLAQDKTYQGIEVQREFGKMANWCRENRKLPTRRRFVAWLNRIDLLSVNIERGEEKEDQGPHGWRAVAHELYPDMFLPESFWDIQSPEVMARIEEKLA